MRQRQRFDMLDGELKDLKLRYENLCSRHETLRLLYLDLLRQRGLERSVAVSEKLVPVWEVDVRNRESPIDGTADGELNSNEVSSWLSS